MPVPEHVYSAAVNGDMAILREYFASGDRDPNDVVARNGWTLLDGACRGKKHADAVWGVDARDISCEAISFLLSQGASFDYQDPEGRTHRPLIIAAAACSMTSNPYADEATLCAPIKLLIDAGADVNAYPVAPGLGFTEGFTALTQAVEKSNMNVVCFLLRHGATMARPRVVDHEERELLERLFAWAPAHATDRRRRTRSAQAAVRASHITPLPRGVFKLVLSFWQSKRDSWWYSQYWGREYRSCD